MTQLESITDPVYSPVEQPGLLDRFALRFVNDPRDLPFLWLTLVASLVMIPFAVALYVPGVLTWWLAAIYLVLNFFGFLDRIVLMLHNTSHRPLFKRGYRLLNRYIPWILCPFFGQSPETYYVHHIGMHHPENNLEDDLSSTMAYRRDSIRGFLRYFFRFLFMVIIDLALYHRRRGRTKLLRKLLVGELTYVLVVVALAFVNWQATLVVFVIPFFVIRFLMMCGNWGQHAFVDAADPGNCYRNSITCINSRYNRRAFNDGYHIGHHLTPNRHWTDMPGEFLENRDVYEREDALVFERIDFFVVWFFLMLKRYDWLAHFFVDLRKTPRTRDEVIALLRERTRLIERTPVAAA